MRQGTATSLNQLPKEIMKVVILFVTVKQDCVYKNLYVAVTGVNKRFLSNGTSFGCFLKNEARGEDE